MVGPDVLPEDSVCLACTSTARRNDASSSTNTGWRSLTAPAYFDQAVIAKSRGYDCDVDGERSMGLAVFVI